MMEIGSIFDIDKKKLFADKKEIKFPLENYYDFKDKKFFNTGRSAIEYLFKFQLCFNNDDIVLIPNFICSSVVKAIERANVKYEYYNITQNFEIDEKDLTNKLNKNVKAIFYVNYFGGGYGYVLKKLSKKYILIEDDTQALFSSNEKIIGLGKYIIGSIRKWLATPDGAILYAQEKLVDVPIENGYNEYMSKYLIAQLMKNEYLNNNILDKEKYLELVKQSTLSLFSDYTIREITRNFL